MLLRFFQKFLFSVSVQIANYAVVRQNFKLSGGKYDG